MWAVGMGALTTNLKGTGYQTGLVPGPEGTAAQKSPHFTVQTGYKISLEVIKEFQLGFPKSSIA